MLQKARAGEHVRVVHDQILTPTYSADLAANVKELIERGAAGLFHVANGGACSWFDFTAELFRLANVSAELTPITTDQSERRARRPAYSALTSTRLQTAGVGALRPWQDALRDYLGKKGELR
jgi:dTDP-4-dehydrorhamnose reductase